MSLTDSLEHSEVSFNKFRLMNVNTNVSPVNHDGPDDRHQQDFVSFEGEGASMKKEGKMRTDHHSKTLGEVPVPGVRAVEISDAVKDVKLQEVELHHGPLAAERATVTYSVTL